MNLSINRKLILNILIFIVMIGVIIFVIRDSLSDIFTELGRTSLPRRTLWSSNSSLEPKNEEIHLHRKKRNLHY